VIANRIKRILYNIVSVEQFVFLFNRKTLDAAGNAQEGLQSIKIS